MITHLPMPERNTHPTVLLVDDEPGIVRLCQRLLEKGGYRVIGVMDPQASMDLIDSEQIDLLLVDIRMPKMDGFELLKWARERQPDLAVVVMTGYGNVETAVEALHRGADGLVLKPFAGNVLLDSVRSALRESQQKQDALRLQTLRPLFAIIEALFGETDPENLRSLLLDSVCSSLRCSRAGLYSCAPNKISYQIVAWRGEPLEEEDIPAFYELLHRAEQESLPICVDLDGAERSELGNFFRSNHLGALMVSSISTQPASSKVPGLMVAFRSVGNGNFRQSDLETYAILAQQASAAFENAHLHSELRAYIRRVEDSQKALLQAEKMAIAGRMTASIAHEINNPLQAVQNCLHLAGRKELPTEDRERYRQMAQTELERLMQTVQQMLEYYRPAGLDRKPVDLNDTVRRVLLLMDPQLVEKNVDYQAKYATGLPEVLVIEDQIQQVLLNLVINAMEAMPEGGKLFVQTTAGEDGVDILVEDTGPGIPIELRERIFEPFVSTKERGTGLGLAVSSGILSAHGGSLELIHGRGRGACFCVHIPVRDL
jgi:signal transduction histidine kinase